MRNNIPTNVPWTGARNRFPRNVATSASDPANQQMAPANPAFVSDAGDIPRLQIAATIVAAGTIAAASAAMDHIKPTMVRPASCAWFA